MALSYDFNTLAKTPVSENGADIISTLFKNMQYQEQEKMVYHQMALRDVSLDDIGLTQDDVNAKIAQLPSRDNIIKQGAMQIAVSSREMDEVANFFMDSLRGRLFEESEQVVDEAIYRMASANEDYMTEALVEYLTSATLEDSVKEAFLINAAEGHQAVLEQLVTKFTSPSFLKEATVVCSELGADVIGSKVFAALVAKVLETNTDKALAEKATDEAKKITEQTSASAETVTVKTLSTPEYLKAASVAKAKPIQVNDKYKLSTPKFDVSFIDTGVAENPEFSMLEHQPHKEETSFEIVTKEVEISERKKVPAYTINGEEVTTVKTSNLAKISDAAFGFIKSLMPNKIKPRKSGGRTRTSLSQAEKDALSVEPVKQDDLEQPELETQEQPEALSEQDEVIGAVRKSKVKPLTQDALKAKAKAKAKAEDANASSSNNGEVTAKEPVTKYQTPVTKVEKPVAETQTPTAKTEVTAAKTEKPIAKPEVKESNSVQEEYEPEDDLFAGLDDFLSGSDTATEEVSQVEDVQNLDPVDTMNDVQDVSESKLKTKMPTGGLTGITLNRYNKLSDEDKELFDSLQRSFAPMVRFQLFDIWKYAETEISIENFEQGIEELNIKVSNLPTHHKLTFDKIFTSKAALQSYAEGRTDSLIRSIFIFGAH